MPLSDCISSSLRPTDKFEGFEGCSLRSNADVRLRKQNWFPKYIVACDTSVYAHLSIETDLKPTPKGPSSLVGIKPTAPPIIDCIACY